MKKVVLNTPEEAMTLEPGRYDLLTHHDGEAGASGFYVNPDKTINTYHNVSTWSSVDQYESDAEELERQVRFPCVVVKAE